MTPEYIDGGNVGYLTWDQFERFRRAVDDMLKHVAWWRVAGYISSGELDVRVQSSNERQLGLPPTWILAEEVTRLSQELNQWPDLEDVAGDEHGAGVALLFTREVETGMARWPIEDRPHRMKYLRCQACSRMSLRYSPPRGLGDRIMVKCRERDCNAILDEVMFERVVIVAKAEHERKQRAGRVGDRGSGDGDAGPLEADDLQVGGGGSGGDDPAAAGAVA